MKAPVYTQKGTKKGEIDLPESVFGVAWNGDLVHQVVISQLANRRQPLAFVKDRSEVRGGGKKPWKQKGTGRARHGSSRSPIWRTGGVTHGPRSNEVNAERQINRKMKRKALYAVLSRKYRDGEVLFVESLAFSEPKTAEAKQTLEALGGIKGYEGLTQKRRNAVYVAVAHSTPEAKRSFHNFGNVHFDEVRNLNATDVARYKYVIITEPHTAFKALAGEVEEAATEAAHA
ncbi:MAG: 50S ribosomal protein L4 [Candidatus Paceibacterota bacterium]